VVDWLKSPGVAGQEEVVCGSDPDPGDLLGTLVSTHDVVSVQVVASVRVLASVIPCFQMVAGRHVWERWMQYCMAGVEVSAWLAEHFARQETTSQG
jgi:hypothetical protein